MLPDHSPAAGHPRPHRLLAVLLTALLLGASGARASDDPARVGFFPPGSGAVPAPWRVVQLNSKIPVTQYTLSTWDGVTAVEARANASMALLARAVALDIRATPVLCWRWRVDAALQSANMATKEGDDYAARVYVAFKLPPDQLSFGLRAKLGIARSIYGDLVPDAAINYVWDNQNPVGTRRFNAYTDRTQMIVQRTGNQHAGGWVTERANVLQDLQKAFGTDQATVNLLAVASDTDNTGEAARAGFADLHFVAADASCQFPPVAKAP